MNDKIASELAIARLEKEIARLQSEIISLNRENELKIGESASVALFVALVVALVLQVNTLDIPLWVFIVVFILYTILQMWLSINEERERIDPIREKLDAKRLELARHRAIVNAE